MGISRMLLSVSQFILLEPSVEYSSCDKYLQLPVAALYIGNGLGADRLRYSFSVQPSRMFSHIFSISCGLGVLVSFTIGFSVRSWFGLRP